MVDFVSPEKRSRIMRGSKSTDTRPELLVRRLLREMGIGYRLHRKDLPGRPDIALIGRKKAIFVHGCFWHQHEALNCPIARHPTSNEQYWQSKFARNKQRDIEDRGKLENAGWDVKVVWECDLLEMDALKRSMQGFLFSAN